MINLPSNAKKLHIQGAPIDYFEFNQSGQEYIYFDASQAPAPEPMMDAIRGLTAVEHKETKLVMIHNHIPQALFDKLGDSYDIQTIDLENGNCQIIFSYKGGNYKKLTLNDFDHRDHYTNRKI